MTNFDKSQTIDVKANKLTNKVTEQVTDKLTDKLTEKRADMFADKLIDKPTSKVSAMLTNKSIDKGPFTYALMRDEYLKAVGHLRGRQRSLNLKSLQKERAACLKSQSILGTAPLDAKHGIEAVKTIAGDKLLDKLSERVVESAAKYFHFMLQKWQVDQNEHTARNHIVIGLSGGADSTLALVLAHKMRELFSYEVEAVHCIHKLDPDDDIWLHNNQKLCERFKIDLSTPELNIRYDLGFSPEEISRDERYRTLCGYLSDKSMLFMGHQADDLAESFMLALKRGSGPQGLQGMKYLTFDTRGLIVRPLLDLHKIEVEQILRSLNVPTVFDLSNSYTKFERNFVRLRVLPLMRERFVSIDESILRSQELIKIEHELAERLVSEKLVQYVKKDERLNLSYFDYEKLDLNDYSLTVMLLRAFFNQVLDEPVEFNYVESLYSLMLGAHDCNGELEIEVNHQTYVVTTHKKRAYVFNKDYINEDIPRSIELKLNLAITSSHVESYDESHGERHGEGHVESHIEDHVESYDESHDESHDEKLASSLSTDGSDKVQLLNFQSVRDGSHGLVVGEVTVGSLSYKALAIAHDASELMLNGALLLENDLAARVILVPRHALALNLNFAYSNSQKIKPRLRVHQRELKKLFLEYDIPRFMRSLYPLVELIGPTVCNDETVSVNSDGGSNAVIGVNTVAEGNAAVSGRSASVGNNIGGVVKDFNVLGMAGVFASGARLQDELTKHCALTELVPIVLVNFHEKAQAWF